MESTQISCLLLNGVKGQRTRGLEESLRMLYPSDAESDLGLVSVKLQWQWDQGNRSPAPAITILGFGKGHHDVIDLGHSTEMDAWPDEAPNLDGVDMKTLIDGVLTLLKNSGAKIGRLLEDGTRELCLVGYSFGAYVATALANHYADPGLVGENDKLNIKLVVLDQAPPAKKSNAEKINVLRSLLKYLSMSSCFTEPALQETSYTDKDSFVSVINDEKSRWLKEVNRAVTDPDAKAIIKQELYNIVLNFLAGESLLSNSSPKLNVNALLLTMNDTVANSGLSIDKWTEDWMRLLGSDVNQYNIPKLYNLKRIKGVLQYVLQIEKSPTHLHLVNKNMLLGVYNSSGLDMADAAAALGRFCLGEQRYNNLMGKTKTSRARSDSCSSVSSFTSGSSSDSEGEGAVTRHCSPQKNKRSCRSSKRSAHQFSRPADSLSKLLYRDILRDGRVFDEALGSAQKKLFEQDKIDYTITKRRCTTDSRKKRKRLLQALIEALKKNEGSSSDYLDRQYPSLYDSSYGSSNPGIFCSSIVGNNDRPRRKKGKGLSGKVMLNARR